MTRIYLPIMLLALPVDGAGESQRRADQPAPPPGHVLLAEWTVVVTAYCPCKECCGPKAHGVTASGKRAKGLVIAAPRGIPFGTWIHVSGYGMAQVEDRGGSIRGNRLDILMPTHAAALVWGRRSLVVQVYTKQKGQ